MMTEPGERQAAGGPLDTGVADARISVVILSFNRVDDVLDTVARTAALPERPHIVVVDNGSSDGTPPGHPPRLPGCRSRRTAAQHRRRGA